MYALLSGLFHDLLCRSSDFYNLSKIDSLSLRLSSNECSSVISATRITTVLDYTEIHKIDKPQIKIVQ